MIQFNCFVTEKLEQQQARSGLPCQKFGWICVRLYFAHPFHGNLLKNSGFVSGHDFSRAVNAAKLMWALAPEGETPYSELPFQQVLRSI
jgi:hypothetical protein